MTNENQATGNGQDHDRSRMQELIRSWTDTRLAYHATTDSEEKRLLAERSELIASEIPAEPGVQEFMEIFEQSLAPRSRPPYPYHFYTLDDLKGLSDAELTRAYAKSTLAEEATEHVGRKNRLIRHKTQIFRELRRRGVARTALNELIQHADENVRRWAKSDLERIEKAVVTQPESQPEPARQLPWQILWQCDHAPPPGLTRAEIAERLRGVLPDFCDALMDLASPAIGLWPQRIHADRAPTASRFGGVPWAPPDWEWPTVEGEPLLFVGHINCAELRGLPGAELLPSSGLLAFFGDHDAVEACRIEAQGDIAVFHWTHVDHLVPAVAPIEPIKTLLECPLAFRPLIDLPDPHSHAIRQLRLSKEQAALYAAEWLALRLVGFPDDVDGYHGFSKLLGWPALVQCDLSCFEYGSDARLLLQVDQYCNGDDTQHRGPGGLLYYLMAQPALQDQNFAACEFEIQFARAFSPSALKHGAGLAMSGPENAADDLTGVWSGMYRQTLVGSVPFTATLIQSGDHLGGSTHEPCIRSDCPRKTHLAVLSGHRSGHSVSFVKSYDPPGFGFDTVNYAGELNADATEIAGVWSIGNVFFGAFVMTRAARRAEVKADAKLTTVE